MKVKLESATKFQPVFWLLAPLLMFQVASSFASSTASLNFNIGSATFSEQLVQPPITSIHKDKNGFLWIGTQSGLNRYNGSKVSVYNSRNERSNWIPASYITQISEDSKGVVWISTYGGGLAKYDEDNDTFDAVSGTVLPAYDFLKSIYISKRGNIWFGTRDSGVGMYDPTLGQFASWLPRNSLNQSMGQAIDFLEDKEGRIWVAGENQLYFIEPDVHLFTPYEPPNSTSSSSSSKTVYKLTTLERGKSNTILVGTSIGDIYKLNISDFSYSLFEVSLPNHTGWITDLHFEENRLWVAKDNGLTVIDIEESVVREFTHSNSLLSSDFILCIMADKETLMVGTARGLDIFSPSAFEKYQSTNSHVFDDVSSFTEDSNNRIWVGTFNGVYLFDESMFTHIPLQAIYPEIKLVDSRITALDIKDNELWIGFFHGGVQVVNLDNGTTFTPDFPTDIDLAITTIFHTKGGSTWVGTYNQGLYKITEKEITSYFGNLTQKNIIPEESIMFVLNVDDDTVLVGTENNLYKIGTTSGVVTPVSKLFGENSAQSVVTSMAYNELDGKIWIGVRDQGIHIWQNGREDFDKPYVVIAEGNSKIPSRTIYAIEFDELGNTWVSTTNGLSKLSSRGEFIKHYRPVDGLQGHDYNLSSSFKDSQGRLYFGGSNGYNRFAPNHKISEPPPPPVILSGLNIAGVSPKLPVAIHQLGSMELSHLDYFVIFEFSVLDYVDPENNQYRYMLEGFDPEWIENGSRNTATYTNLPSGHYTFRVQGASSAGIWNRNGISMKIVAHPAPWYTWQAYLLYFILISGFGLLAKKYYDNVVLRRKATAMATEMHYAADRATDDLQEQLEYQDKFVTVVHSHTKNTLSFIRDVINQQALYVENDLVKEAVLNSSLRVAALAQLEQCLFYQGEALLFNLERYTNIIISDLLGSWPEKAKSVTTINDVSSDLVPAYIATPISIVIHELVRNSFQHAFENSPSINFIHIKMETIKERNQDNLISIILTVEDSGCGLPINIRPETAETSGMAIVNSISQSLNGNLDISTQSGTNIVLTFLCECVSQPSFGMESTHDTDYI